MKVRNKKTGEYSEVKYTGDIYQFYDSVPPLFKGCTDPMMERYLEVIFSDCELKNLFKDQLDQGFPVVRNQTSYQL